MWIYQGKEFLDVDPKFIGFVYIITEISTGKKYIGKKKFCFKKTSYKTVTVKSTGLKKKKKIRSLVQSDWCDYYGSSDALLEQIKINGVKNYHREIVYLCESETDMSYMEAKLQFDTDCLRKPDEYYNAWIMVRIRRSNLI
jgi:hypothetical protein